MGTLLPHCKLMLHVLLYQVDGHCFRSPSPVLFDNDELFLYFFSGDQPQLGLRSLVEAESVFLIVVNLISNEH